MIFMGEKKRAGRGHNLANYHNMVLNFAFQSSGCGELVTTPGAKESSLCLVNRPIWVRIIQTLHETWMMLL